MTKLELLIPTYKSYDKVNAFIAGLAKNVLCDQIRLLLSFDMDEPKLESFVSNIHSPYIRIVKNEGLNGLDANIKNCIRNCTSEYFWILSHDDIIEDSVIFAVYKFLNIVKLDLLFLDYYSKDIIVAEVSFTKINNWFDTIGFRSSFLPSVVYRKQSLGEDIPDIDYKNWYDFILQFYIEKTSIYKSNIPLIKLTGVSHDSPWNIEPVMSIYELYCLVRKTGKVRNKIILNKIRPYVLKKIMYAKAKNKNITGFSQFLVEYKRENMISTMILIGILKMIPSNILKLAYEVYQKQKHRVV